MTVRPYSDRQGSKREQVEEMFDSISPRYDLLNRVMTAGLDGRWREAAGDAGYAKSVLTK